MSVLTEVLKIIIIAVETAFILGRDFRHSRAEEVCKLLEKKKRF